MSSRPMNNQQRMDKRQKEKRTRLINRLAGLHLHYDEKDVARIYEKQGGGCLYCQQPLPEDFHIDHFVPLSKGGVDTADNIVCACPACNRAKRNQLPWQWDQWQGQFPVEWDWNWCGPYPRL